jgi:hypothetical protein
MVLMGEDIRLGVAFRVLTPRGQRLEVRLQR